MKREINSESEGDTVSKECDFCGKKIEGVEYNIINYGEGKSENLVKVNSVKDLEKNNEQYRKEGVMKSFCSDKCFLEFIKNLNQE